MENMYTEDQQWKYKQEQHEFLPKSRKVSEVRNEFNLVNKTGIQQTQWDTLMVRSTHKSSLPLFLSPFDFFGKNFLRLNILNTLFDSQVFFKKKNYRTRFKHVSGHHH